MAEPVLLYDGTCGLCAWSVRFVLGHERRRDLRFASLGGSFAQSVIGRHPGLRGLDTVVWYEPDGGGRPARVLTRSQAVLQVVRYLGWPWRLFLVAGVVPRPILDTFYDVVARHRRRLFRGDACLVPSPSQRARFLD